MKKLMKLWKEMDTTTSALAIAFVVIMLTIITYSIASSVMGEERNFCESEVSIEGFMTEVNATMPYGMKKSFNVKLEMIDGVDFYGFARNKKHPEGFSVCQSNIKTTLTFKKDANAFMRGFLTEMIKKMDGEVLEDGSLIIKSRKIWWSGEKKYIEIFASVPYLGADEAQEESAYSRERLKADSDND